MDLVVRLDTAEVLMLTDSPPRERLSPPSRRERRAERRRLRQLDALSARLAELHAIRALLEHAEDVIHAGWIQGAWFSVASEGGERVVPAYDVRSATDRPVVGACLVGAVVHAAGGPAAVRSQLVQRTLDLTWHTLREDPSRPVHWCPGPRTRMMQVLELTHWNDAPQRTREDVVNLLAAGRGTVEVQRQMCQDQQVVLSVP